MKSSFSASGNSVDVSLDPEGRVLVRHSRQPDPGRPCVVFTRAEWEAFLRGAQAGEFAYGKLPLAASPLPLAKVLSDRHM